MIRNLYITGFMGAGKSTLGLALSTALQWQFVDTDAVVSEIEKLSIAEIFRSKGASYFRKQEQLCLSKVIQRENQVIALGGGTPLDSKCRKMIQASGRTIYLKVPFDILFNRLQKESSNRPLLQDKKGEELRSIMLKLLEEREPHYEAISTYVFSYKEHAIPDIVRQIIKGLRK